MILILRVSTLGEDRGIFCRKFTGDKIGRPDLQLIGVCPTRIVMLPQGIMRVLLLEALTSQDAGLLLDPVRKGPSIMDPLHYAKGTMKMNNVEIVVETKLITMIAEDDAPETVPRNGEEDHVMLLAIYPWAAAILAAGTIGGRVRMRLTTKIDTRHSVVPSSTFIRSSSAISGGMVGKKKGFIKLPAPSLPTSDSATTLLTLDFQL